MDIRYIKYGLITLGAIAAIITFIMAYKLLGPPTFRNDEAESQVDDKDLSPTDIE